ncbi:MAG: sulfotransferase domain-containing protein [Limibacillus sp.]
MGIYWIASYPKSGNTWVRAFIANLMAPEQPVPLNQIPNYVPSESAIGWYQKTGCDLETLFKPSIEGARIRGQIQEKLEAMTGGRHLLMKTHNMLGAFDGVPLIRDDLTVGALYIVRDPRDVAISVSKHFGITLDEAIEFMAAPKAYTGGGKDKRSIFEHLGSWPDHVRSWTQADVPVFRYEDLLARPGDSFRRIAKLLGMDGKASTIERAIEAASFKNLQAAEDRDGFLEASGKSERFFRAGKAGGWREVLSDDQAARLAALDEDLMKRFNYGP